LYGIAYYSYPTATRIEDMENIENIGGLTSDIVPITLKITIYTGYRTLIPTHNRMVAGLPAGIIFEYPYRARVLSGPPMAQVSDSFGKSETYLSINPLSIKKNLPLLTLPLDKIYQILYYTNIFSIQSYLLIVRRRDVNSN